MTAKQKFAIVLLALGLFLSASPLLVTMGTQGLVAPECVEVDALSQECVRYSGDLPWVLFSTFVAVGQKHLFFTVPIGIVLIITAFILSFIEAPKANTFGRKE